MNLSGLSLDLTLRSGGVCRIAEPGIPFLRDYFVLWVAAETSDPSPQDLEELAVLAQRVGRELAWRRFGDHECYSLIYNAARTRRKTWPHIHIVVADSTWAKRRAFNLLQWKHLLRFFRGR